MTNPEDHISVQHFKLRAKHVIAALCSLSIDISSQMKDYVDPICNEIYNIYLSTGGIYVLHTNCVQYRCVELHFERSYALSGI